MLSPRSTGGEGCANPTLPSPSTGWPHRSCREAEQEGDERSAEDDRDHRQRRALHQCGSGLYQFLEEVQDLRSGAKELCGERCIRSLRSSPLRGETTHFALRPFTAVKATIGRPSENVKIARPVVCNTAQVYERRRILCRPADWVPVLCARAGVSVAAAVDRVVFERPQKVPERRLGGANRDSAG